MVAEQALERGREALQAGRWQDARLIFEAMLREDDLPEALAGLGDALFWLGDTRQSIRYRERAYVSYRRRGEKVLAADSALWLCIVSDTALGNVAVSKGWLARCESLLEGVDAGSLAGWLDLCRAAHVTNHVACRELLERCLKSARELDDVDLELCALGELGVLLVKMGEVEAGLRCVDEAMARALGGERRLLDTVIFTTCSMMTACDLVADLPRATQWARAADEFTKIYGGPYLFAYCRTIYARVLVVTGHWTDAETELQRAAIATKDSFPAMYVRVVANLAHLRLRQGRAAEAASLIESVAQPHETAIVAAEVALERGEPQAAVAFIERWLQAEDDHVFGPRHAGGRGLSLEMAYALCLLVQARLAANDREGAAVTAERLAGLGSAGSVTLAGAYSTYCLGLLCANDGLSSEAADHLQGAAQRFTRLELPFETACSRLELARVLKTSQPELAAIEARAAFQAFDRLGARGHADVAAALLRSWGVHGRTGPREAGVLTQREREVLDLVAAGLSNAEIAGRLYISPKTAAHHVSSLLTKLGMRNRAEAAAYAVRSIKQP